MATAQDLLDDLNDRLNDENNAAGAGEATKLRWLNHALRAMYPRIYRALRDDSITTTADTWEYELPNDFDHAKIWRVEIESDTSGRWLLVERYRILPMGTGKILQLSASDLYSAGRTLRVWGVAPLTALSASGSTYEGPPGTEEIPVWYALGLAMNRRHEDRIDYTRLSTVAVQNGVDIEEVMSSSQFCFAQFEMLLDRHAMAVPGLRG